LTVWGDVGHGDPLAVVAGKIPVSAPLPAHAVLLIEEAWICARLHGKPGARLTIDSHPPSDCISIIAECCDHPSMRVAVFRIKLLTSNCVAELFRGESGVCSAGSTHA